MCVYIKKNLFLCVPIDVYDDVDHECNRWLQYFPRLQPTIISAKC